MRKVLWRLTNLGLEIAGRGSCGAPATQRLRSAFRRPMLYSRIFVHSGGKRRAATRCSSPQLGGVCSAFRNATARYSEITSPTPA